MMADNASRRQYNIGALAIYIDPRRKRYRRVEKPQLLPLHTNGPDPKVYLLQYRKDVWTVVHVLAHGREVGWPNCFERVPNKAIYVEDELGYIATLLLAHENVERMIREFQKLKTYSYDLCTKVTDVLYFNEYPWLLVVYQWRLKSMVYKIVNRRDTARVEDNEYPESVTYLVINNLLYQAIILKKARYVRDIMPVFNRLVYKCSRLRLPFRRQTVPYFGKKEAMPFLRFRSLFGISSSIEEDRARLEYLTWDELLSEMEKQDRSAAYIRYLKWQRFRKSRYADSPDLLLEYS